MDLQEAFDKGFEAVKSYIDGEFAARPAIPGPPGEAGPPGERGERGEPGVGEKGEAGRDGRDAADLSMLRGIIAEQLVIGIGAVFKAMTITTPDSGRTLVVAFGDQVHNIKTEIPLDKGVWTEGLYEAGDAVSHGGSLFIAQTETSEKPEKKGGGGWRLAVKRGNDGRDWRADDKRNGEPVRFK